MEPIYLDHNATTPVAPEVVDAMLVALREAWGNPSSSHAFGPLARKLVEKARDQVAVLLECDPAEVVFTSGGTESDNTAITGVAEALAGKGRHIVISSIEHPAVEEAARHLEIYGFSVTRVGVDRSGRVDPAEVAAALRPDTILVSVMHANNETGVIQPIGAVARAARARGILVHTDAAQSVGKIPVRVRDLDVDLLTVAGHKLYAPKGVGALIVRRGIPPIGILHGGGQEQGRRPGTENVAGIAGLGAACALAARELGSRQAHLLLCRDRLEAALRERLPGLVVHGAGAERLPNTLLAAMPGIDANALLASLDGVAASAGAACHAGATEPSRVLLAMGVSPEVARSTLRFSTGRRTTSGEIDRAAALVADAATRMRERPAPSARTSGCPS